MFKGFIFARNLGPITIIYPFNVKKDICMFVDNVRLYSAQHANFVTF